MVEPQHRLTLVLPWRQYEWLKQTAAESEGSINALLREMIERERGSK